MISSTKSTLLAMTELKKKERKNETNYSIQTLYTVTIKQKEHIKDKGKMPR
jgi:hypothetical protein